MPLILSETAERMLSQMLDTVEEMLCITLEMVLLMLFQMEETTFQIADKTEEMKNDILKRLQDAEAAVENAYAKDTEVKAS